MKKVFILIITFTIFNTVALFTAAYIAEKNGYEVSSYITEDIREKCTDLYADLCLAYEYTPELVTDYADNIVVATVISKDSMKPDEGLFGTTNGRLLIQKILKGDLKEGQVVKYLKNGGVMKFEDWDKNQPQASINKREYLKQKSNAIEDEEYVNICLSDDVEIQEGYTYLINLKKLDDRYEIIGLDVGVREVDVNYTNRVSLNSLETNSLMIKNNKTNEFESLQGYIDKYIGSGEKE